MQQHPRCMRYSRAASPWTPPPSAPPPQSCPASRRSRPPAAWPRQTGSACGGRGGRRGRPGRAARLRGPQAAAHGATRRWQAQITGVGAWACLPAPHLPPSCRGRVPAVHTGSRSAASTSGAPRHRHQAHLGAQVRLPRAGRRPPGRGASGQASCERAQGLGLRGHHLQLALPFLVCWGSLVAHRCYGAQGAVINMLILLF